MNSILKAMSQMDNAFTNLSLGQLAERGDLEAVRHAVNHDAIDIKGLVSALRRAAKASQKENFQYLFDTLEQAYFKTREAQDHSNTLFPDNDLIALGGSVSFGALHGFEHESEEIDLKTYIRNVAFDLANQGNIDMLRFLQTDFTGKHYLNMFDTIPVHGSDYLGKRPYVGESHSLLTSAIFYHQWDMVAYLIDGQIEMGLQPLDINQNNGAAISYIEINVFKNNGSGMKAQEKDQQAQALVDKLLFDYGFDFTEAAQAQFLKFGGKGILLEEILEKQRKRDLFMHINEQITEKTGKPVRQRKI